MKSNIAEPYISALEEQQKVNHSWRAFQNFLECSDVRILEKIRNEVNQITQVLSEQRDYINKMKTLYKVNILTDESIPMVLLDKLEKALGSEFDVKHFEIHDKGFTDATFNLDLMSKRKPLENPMDFVRDQVNKAIK